MRRSGYPRRILTAASGSLNLIDQEEDRMEYGIETVTRDKTALNTEVDRLLEQEGIQRDGNLDYTCAIVDETGAVAATGSCFQNTLRCFAVSREHQGEGLMNQLLTHLTRVQLDRGNSRLFVYTKTESAKFFQDLGYHLIAHVPGRVSFLENRRTGFPNFLRGLVREYSGVSQNGVIGAVVMNANPFTLGHQYLVEWASAQCDVLHLFVVSEDASVIPFHVRWSLVKAGTAHLNNVVLHETGPYLISSATFPSYFLKDEALVSRGHAELDAAVFGEIAKALHISRRYLGDEPVSRVTALYNEVLAEELPRMGVECAILPRKQGGGGPISASTVRQCIHDGKWDPLGTLLPETTLAYFRSKEAADVIRAIQNSETLVHH